MVYYKQGRLDEAIEDAQSMMNEGYRNSSIYGMLGYFKLLRMMTLTKRQNFVKKLMITTVMTGT